jgi:hypothetical protein
MQPTEAAPLRDLSRVVLGDAAVRHRLRACRRRAQDVGRSERGRRRHAVAAPTTSGNGQCDQRYGKKTK